MLRLLLAAVVLLAPLGQAALLEDAQGDVRFGANDAPAAAPASPAYASMDLVSLDVIEEADAFTFAVQVDDLAQAEDTAPDGEICDVWMTHNGREFRIHMTRLTPAILGGRAELRSRDAGGAWDRHAEADLESTFDLATDIITLRLARADLADASGAAPYPGRVLTDVRASCRNHASGVSVVGGVTPTSPVMALDELPDLGLPSGSWLVSIGAEQTGHALLTSPQPFRASNGEATTFAYNVTARNTGAAGDEFTIAARNVPEHVNVSLAADRLAIDGGGEASFTVWVSVPFAHDHGSARSFILELASASDPGSVGRLELGVRYLAVPQPSGHHDTLFIHSFPQEGVLAMAVDTAPGLYGNDGYLSTLEDDPGDAHDPITFSSAGNGATEDRASWDLELSPGLLMGLDADLSRLGQLTARFGARTPMELTVSADVRILGAGDPILLASMAPTAATPSGEGYEVVGDLVPQAEADLVPYQPGQRLMLELTAINTGPSALLALDTPWLTGGWLRLPLLDYHDSVEGLPASGAIVLAGEPIAAAGSGPGPRDAPGASWLAGATLAAAALLRRR